MQVAGSELAELVVVVAVLELTSAAVAVAGVVVLDDDELELDPHAAKLAATTRLKPRCVTQRFRTATSFPSRLSIGCPDEKLKIPIVSFSPAHFANTVLSASGSIKPHPEAVS